MYSRIGQQFGNYRLTQLLGQGGFAGVYLAEHIHLKTQAAVKLLYGMSAKDVRAFIDEARILAALRHPSILRILEFGFEQTDPFLVMDYASGGTLRDRHPDGSVLPLAVVTSYVKQVATALAYAHAQKLIHRDVKPENMLIDANRDILLGDFGIAAVAHRTASRKTIDNAGTVDYMAPEQIKGKPQPASDQYALATVVYEWLCGDLPFVGNTAIEIAMQHISETPPPLRQKAPSLSINVEQVIMRSLATDPDQRFSDILTFYEALEQASSSSKKTATLKPLPQSPSPALPVLSSLDSVKEKIKDLKRERRVREALAVCDQALEVVIDELERKDLLKERIGILKLDGRYMQEALGIYHKLIETAASESDKLALFREMINLLRERENFGGAENTYREAEATILDPANKLNLAREHIGHSKQDGNLYNIVSICDKAIFDAADDIIKLEFLREKFNALKLLGHTMDLLRAYDQALSILASDHDRLPLIREKISVLRKIGQIDGIPHVYDEALVLMTDVVCRQELLRERAHFFRSYHK